MTQEIGKVVALDGKLDFSKFPIGSMLKILPHHVSFLRTMCQIMDVEKYIIIACGIKLTYNWSACTVATVKPTYK